MENVDLRCPRCGSDHTTRMPIELLDGIKGTWYLLIICSLFGIALSPICIIICLGCVVIGIIYNSIRKISYKNQWVMQCQRCGCEFIVQDPDKETIKLDKQIKEKNKQSMKQEKQRMLQKAKRDCLERNGMLEKDEVLLFEIQYFGFHKNFCSNSNGKLKITDKGLICYNDKGSFRIQRNKIVKIKKKNYLLCIPTGIQIVVSDKRKYYNFVVMPNERTQILEKLKL